MGRFLSFFEYLFLLLVLCCSVRIPAAFYSTRRNVVMNISAATYLSLLCHPIHLPLTLAIMTRCFNFLLGGYHVGDLPILFIPRS